MNNNIHSKTENDFNNGFIKHNINNLENVKLSDIMENIKLKTNIKFIDSNTSIYKGTTLLIAGGKNSNKEALLKDIALNIANNSKNILYISCDTNSKTQDIVNSIRTKCIDKFHNDDAINNIKILNIPKLNIARLAEKLATMCTFMNLDAIFIEDNKYLMMNTKHHYINKKEIPFSDPAEELSYISKIFNTSIFLGCRISQASEQNRLILSLNDIKYSSSLTNISRVILGVNPINKSKDIKSITVKLLKMPMEQQILKKKYI